jgi:hypothetical protein
MSDDLSNYADSPIAPAMLCFAITPSDSQPLPQLTKALYIGEGGNLVLRSALGDTDVTFANVPSGYILDVRAISVRATGTTATAIIGLA